nr:hypothetical protein [Mucilaginibacter sp. Bleaf8]
MLTLYRPELPSDGYDPEDLDKHPRRDFRINTIHSISECLCRKWHFPF